MKDQHKHLMLWQKRNELRIDDEAQQDWLDMQAMLDKHMPVSPNAGTGGGSSYFSGFKLLTALIIAAAATVVLYFVVVKGDTKNNQHKKADSTVTVSNNSKLPKSANINDTSGLNENRSTENSRGNTISNTSDNASPAGDSSAGNAASRGDVNSAGTVDGAKDVGAVKNNDRAENTASHGHAITANRNNLPGRANNSTANVKKVLPGNSTGKAHLSQNRITNNNGRRYFTKSNSGVKNEKTAGSRNRGLRNRIAAGNSGINSGSRHHGAGTGKYRPGKDNKASKNGKGRVSSDTDKQNSQLNNLAINKDKNGRDTGMLMPQIPQFIAEPYMITALPLSIVDKYKAVSDTSSSPNKKAKPGKAPGGSGFDYGILAGINASGSFTAKEQNKNFYGSFPVDVFFGAFATYHFSDKWGINLQLRGLNPQNVSGTYTHSNDSKKDTNQVLVMTDSRKIYTADAALHLIFKPAAGLSLKAGPVFGYALKEANGNTTFQTGPLKKDSAYYVSVVKLINATTYTKGFTMGLSAGASYQYGRFIFDAAYNRNFGGLKAGSTLGSYSDNTSSFLFTVGFKLNRLKK
jgi:hypothetical protein